MNQLIKSFVFVCLLVSALFVWLAVMLAGFCLSFTNLVFMYNVTPFIGLAVVICIIKCAMYVLLKSNPMAYFEEKVNKVGAWFK